MWWMIAVGATGVVAGGLTFIFRAQLHAGRNANRESIGLAADTRLEPRSDLGYALVRSVPLCLLGGAFVLWGLFGNR